MASLAAIFVVFSTLSMTVSELARELEMTRSVGLTRTQMAAIIAIESVMPELIGLLDGEPLQLLQSGRGSQ